MNAIKRIGIGAAGLLAAGALVAPAVLAEDTGSGSGGISCTISGNGADSTNRCNITVRGGGHSNPCNNTCQGTGSAQSSKTKIKNRVFVISNTGGNKANKNTGGSVSITTGDSNVNVSITNNVNN